MGQASLWKNCQIKLSISHAGFFSTDTGTGRLVGWTINGERRRCPAVATTATAGRRLERITAGMKGARFGWAYSSVSDLVDSNHALHKRRLRDIRSRTRGLDNKLPVHVKEYGAWRASSPRWVESNEKRRTKALNNEDLAVRIRTARADVDKNLRRQTVEYAEYRAKNPRWRKTTVRRSVEDQRMANLFQPT